jgi:hypothetical protein
MITSYSFQNHVWFGLGFRPAPPSLSCEFLHWAAEPKPAQLSCKCSIKKRTRVPHCGTILLTPSKTLARYIHLCSRNPTALIDLHHQAATSLHLAKGARGSEWRGARQICGDLGCRYGSAARESPMTTSVRIPCPFPLLLLVTSAFPPFVFADSVVCPVMLLYFERSLGFFAAP